MELYEIKNGLEDARLLLDQLYVSANIEVLKKRNRRTNCTDNGRTFLGRSGTCD